MQVQQEVYQKLRLTTYSTKLLDSISSIMTRSFSYKRVLLGVAAGIVGSLVGFILVYVVGVVAIGISLKDFFAMLLAAVTVLPLMLILVFFLPNMLIGTGVGVLLGVGSNFRARSLGVVAGALLGLVCCEIVLSFVFPRIMPPQSDPRFFNIITNPYLTGAYGLLLGALTGRIFRWFDGKQSRP